MELFFPRAIQQVTEEEEEEEMNINVFVLLVDREVRFQDLEEVRGRQEQELDEQREEQRLLSLSLSLIVHSLLRVESGVETSSSSFSSSLI